MLQIVMVGLGAGAAAALLFASVVSGSFVAVLLFYLAPLPILIAALGWSHLAGLIAAALATAIIAVLSGAFSIAVPVIAFGAWWLGYLTLLARAPTNGGGTELEWYPIGRLLLWSAVIGTLIVAAAVPNFDQQSLEAALRKTGQRIVHDQAVVDLLVVAVPPAAAVFSTITNVLNLWLAARVVKISGRLKRPWPDLSALTLPPSAAGLLAVAALGSFLPDLAGILSGAFAASLLMVFAFLGFAVLHTITRGTAGRGFVLAGIYASAILGDWLVLPAVTRLLASPEWLVLRVWPLLAIMALGVAETLFNIRLRLAQRHQPPSLPTQ